MPIIDPDTVSLPSHCLDHFDDRAFPLVVRTSPLKLSPRKPSERPLNSVSFFTVLETWSSLLSRIDVKSGSLEVHGVGLSGSTREDLSEDMNLQTRTLALGSMAERIQFRVLTKA